MDYTGLTIGGHKLQWGQDVSGNFFSDLCCR